MASVWRWNAHKKTIFLALTTGSLPFVLAYQNCSGSNFATPAGSQMSATPTSSSCSMTCAVPNGVGIQSCSVNSLGAQVATSSTCTMTQCNFGYTAQNGSCAANSVQYRCTGYEALAEDASGQLVTSAGLQIPAQNVGGSGTCYYYTMSTQTLSGNSSQTGQGIANHDQDVISADHDMGGGDKIVWHPYIMKHSTMTLNMAGVRNLQLAGGVPSSTAGYVATSADDITIDNFFLIGVYPEGTALTPANLNSYYSAWGSGDSIAAAPSGATGIAFNPAGINLNANNSTDYGSGNRTPYNTTGISTSSPYALIPLNVESSGGAAVVPPVSLNSAINAQTPMTIDFRALDCGGQRTLNPIYLLVQ
jgi:hypothetical protein